MAIFTRVAPLLPAGPEEILRPARPWFVGLTLFVALLLDIVPLSGIALLLRPDFVALVLLYWCVHEPRFVGVGVAWCVGLVVDVADATLFGQHALVYAVLACTASYFRRRVLRFPLWQQAAQVAVLLVMAALLTLALRTFGGAAVPRMLYFVAPVIGALLWPAVSVLLQWPQRPVRSSAER